MNRRRKRGGEKGEYELTFTPVACIGLQGRLAAGGLPAAPALPRGSQGCPGEPSLPSTSNGSGCHGAKA